MCHYVSFGVRPQIAHPSTSWGRSPRPQALEDSTSTALRSPSTPICQGGQVANLWQPLHDTGIHIDFSHNTFPWDNEVMYVSFGV